MMVSVRLPPLRKSSHPISSAISWTAVLLLASITSGPANAIIPDDVHMRCLKAPDWTKCLNGYFDPIKARFLKCVRKLRVHENECVADFKALDEGLSRYARENFVADLFAQAGVPVLIDKKEFPNSAPKELAILCKQDGLQGFYSSKDKAIVICTQNQSHPGTGWGLEVMIHEAVHAAQHCVGGSLKKIPPIRKAFFSKTLWPSEFREVIELYEPEDQELEIEARQFSGDSFDVAILLNYACQKS